MHPEPAADAPPSETQPTDAELIAAHLAGDPEAFGIVVRRHRDRMWAIALRMMRNPEDAADALQDAYVSAFRRAGSFRGDSALTTWLHRVVVNACLDRLRRMKLRVVDPLPDDLDGSSSETAIPAVGPEPSEAVEAAERRELVAAALAQLNPDQRAALILVDMLGYPVDEAALILDCAVGTVKSRCARGRARLVPLLAALREPG